MTDYEDNPFEPKSDKELDVDSEINQDRRNVELEDLRKVLSMPEGRRVLWRYLATANLKVSSFRGENTHNSAYQEGIKQIGRVILQDIEDSKPEAYFQMHKDAVQLENTLKKMKENDMARS